MPVHLRRLGDWAVYRGGLKLRFYESGGSHGAWGRGAGVEKIGTPSAAYPASFPTVLHPAGL